MTVTMALAIAITMATATAPAHPSMKCAPFTDHDFCCVALNVDGLDAPTWRLYTEPVIHLTGLSACFSAPPTWRPVEMRVNAADNESFWQVRALVRYDPDSHKVVFADYGHGVQP